MNQTEARWANNFLGVAANQRDENQSTLKRRVKRTRVLQIISARHRTTIMKKRSPGGRPHEEERPANRNR